MISSVYSLSKCLAIIVLFSFSHKSAMLKLHVPPTKTPVLKVAIIVEGGVSSILLINVQSFQALFALPFVPILSPYGELYAKKFWKPSKSPAEKKIEVSQLKWKQIILATMIWRQNIGDEHMFTIHCDLASVLER